MTRAAFDKLMSLLQGAFHIELEEKTRDAYWLVLAADPDEAVFAEAKSYLRDRERSRYGFPKPADLVPQSLSAPPYHRELKSLPAPAPLSPEEAKELLGPMRKAIRTFPEPPRARNRLRQLRDRFPKPEGAA